MKIETLVKKMNAERKDWLKRIAWRVFESALINDFGNFRHAIWSGCQECVTVKVNALSTIRLIRSLR